ncbi:hypothetical protein FRC10_005296, partial [Ceratobasidium sp. 414]
MKRQLQDAWSMLDKFNEHPAADEELDRAMDNLERQVHRVQDDLEPAPPPAPVTPTPSKEEASEEHAA